MHFGRRTIVRSLAAGLALASVGCAGLDRPTATDPGRPFFEIGVPDWVHNAAGLRGKPLERAQRLSDTPSASALIGPEGGVLELPGTGLRLLFPAGAVGSPTTITASVAHKRFLSYRFEPHGTTFAQPVIVEQTLAGTPVDGQTAEYGNVRGSYTREPFTEDAGNQTINADDSWGAAVDATSRRASFAITHFSGYQLVVARKGF